MNDCSPPDPVADARREGQRAFEDATHRIDRKQRRTARGRAQIAAAKATAMAAEYGRLLFWLDALDMCDKLTAS